MTIPKKRVADVAHGSRRDSSTPLGMTAKTLNRTSALCRGFHAGFACRAYKIRKKLLREGIFGHAFRMPLHADHPILRRLQFHAFDDSVGAARSDPQLLSRAVVGLVMAPFDGDIGSAPQFFHLTAVP